MAIDLDILKSDLNFMINDFPPVVFEWQSRLFTAAKMQMTCEREFELYGETGNVSFSLNCQLSDFILGEFPLAGDWVTVENVKYKVISSIVDSVNIGLRVDVGEGK